MPYTLSLRYAIALIGGVIVTISLLYLMHALISSDENPLNEAPSITLLEYQRVIEDEAPEMKDLKPKRPPEPDEPPPELRSNNIDQTSIIGVEIRPPNPNVEINPSESGFSADGEYLPIVKVLPIYPRRALSRGIEGYVIVEFCVTAQGTVRDPVVVESEPSSIFDRAAINASLKFKYKPKIVNETPVEICGVPNRFTFEMGDG